MQALLEDFFSDSSALFQQLATRLPQLTGRMLGNVSEGIFALITGILSGFMLSVRLPAIKTWLQQRISKEQHQRLRELLQALRHGLLGWLQAQLKLAGVTLGVLAIGLWVLQVDRWLALAALIAVVDAFPVLGVGTVLLPWALVCLLLGQTARGVGLTALFATIWLLRSLLEPRLVGKGIGLDPLLTLAAIYAGFRFWGIPGMILAPLLALLVVLIWQQFPRQSSPPSPR
jgi:predicted PurR-regulated permease PerM